MDITSLHNRLIKRYAPSELLSVLAYDPMDELYYHEDGALGYAFICYPMIGVDEGRIQQLQVLIGQNYPAGTIMQVSLWASPDIERALARMQAIRQPKEGEAVGEGRQRATGLVETRVEFLRRHTLTPVSERTGIQVRDVNVLVSVKVPCRTRMPSERDTEEVKRLRRSTHQILETLGMFPRGLGPERLLRVLGSMVNWSPNASWRSPALLYDEGRLIREQLFDAETPVRVDARGLWLGDTRVKTLCVKRLPEYVHLAQAARFLGDTKTGQRGVRENVLITLNVLFPDAEESRTAMAARKTTATWQSLGPLSRYVPRLRLQKESFDALFEALEDGDRVVRAYLTFCLFETDDERATAGASNLMTYYRELGYRLQEDQFVALPLFLNALPLGAERSAAKNLMRYRTMAGRHAVHLMPVVGDWKGTGTPVVTLLSRNGQLMGIDLFDSPTNFSALVAAESGSGKSFFVNFLLANYMSLGADIYLIEVGRSFKNTCQVLGGEHIEFDANHQLSLNPFSHIVDYEDQADLLIAVLVAMISPSGEISEYQVAQLRRIVNLLWHEHGNEVTLDLLARTLREYRDEDNHLDRRVNDMGIQLGPFIQEGDGEYGRWFGGDATITFKRSLTVLELEELKERRHLMKVVLVQLIAIIQRAMYLGDPHRPKLLIVDEGWDLITEGVEGNFIERGVRQLRKYRGGAVLILQSVNDLYKTGVGEAIAENTANKFLLGQTPEAVESLIKSGRLALGEGAGDLIKSVHTVKGEYSEIFVYTRGGGGIARLMVDRRTQLLYSTDPADKHALKRRLDAGMDLDAAISDIIATEERSKRLAV